MVADEALFEKKKNEFNKLKVPSCVSEIKTTRGIVNKFIKTILYSH